MTEVMNIGTLAATTTTVTNTKARPDVCYLVTDVQTAVEWIVCGRLTKAQFQLQLLPGSLGPAKTSPDKPVRFEIRNFVWQTNHPQLYLSIDVRLSCYTAKIEQLVDALIAKGITSKQMTHVLPDQHICHVLANRKVTLKSPSSGCLYVV